MGMAVEATLDCERRKIVRGSAGRHLEMALFARTFQMSNGMNENSLDMPNGNNARIGDGDRRRAKGCRHLHEAVLGNQMTSDSRTSQPLKTHLFVTAGVSGRNLMAGRTAKASSDWRVMRPNQQLMQVVVERLLEQVTHEEFTLHHRHLMLSDPIDRWMLVAPDAGKRSVRAHIGSSASV